MQLKTNSMQNEIKKVEIKKFLIDMQNIINLSGWEIVVSHRSMDTER